MAVPRLEGGRQLMFKGCREGTCDSLCHMRTSRARRVRMRQRAGMAKRWRRDGPLSFENLEMRDIDIAK